MSESEDPKPESEDPKDPKKVTNNDLRDSQFGGAFINADIVNAQRIGGDIWNIKIFFFGQQEAVSDKQLTRQEYENRRILLSKVRNSWVQGVLERSLHSRALIELGLEERLDAVNHLGEMIWETPDQPRQILPLGTRVIDKFDEMVAGRTLLILGEPGSGKTTILLKLARDLIDRAENDVNQPIPVVFNLSSWRSDKQNQTIADWLVQRLNQEYKVSKKVGDSWVNNQQLLLLLDGLDEVKEERRNLCVQALNRFRQDYGETEIVIASRVGEYENLFDRLDLQIAIYLQALTQEQINDYFDSAGSQLAVIKTLWQEDETLQELAKFPLTLNIMTFAYQGVKIENFPTINSLDERRKHLFDKYIQQMFERRRSLKKKPYSKEESVRWLILLAKRMSQERETVFLIERMQPSWLPSRTDKKIYRITVNLIVGVVIGLTAVLYFIYYFELLLLDHNIHRSNALLIQLIIIGMLSGLISGVIAGLLSIQSKRLIRALVLGTTFALFIFLFFNLLEPQLLRIYMPPIYLAGIFSGLIFSSIREEIKPPEIWELKWELIFKNSLIFAVFGIVYKLARFLLITEVYQVKDILYSNSMIEVMIFMMIGAIYGGLKIQKKDTKSAKPGKGIIRSGKYMVLSFATLVVAATLVSWNLDGIRNPVTICLGLSVGLVGGLISNDSSGIVYIKHYVLRIILWFKGYTPWNYARFLDYATERIFLQKVGWGYIFIHRLLQDHFAQMEFEIKHPK